MERGGNIKSTLEKEFESKDGTKENEYDWYAIFPELLSSSWQWRRAVSSHQDTDHMLRILIMGDKKVGKTALLFRLVRNKISEEDLRRKISKFEMSHRVTHVHNVVTKVNMKLQIFDTNMEDNSSYIKTCVSYLSLTHIIIITYDISRKGTFFNALNKWYRIVKQRKQHHQCLIYLVGCKSDLTRRVLYQEGEEAAKKFGFKFFETSCLRDKTDDLYNHMIQIIANTGHQQFVSDYKPYEPKWPRMLMDDPNIRLVLRKPVVKIPEYTKYEDIKKDENGALILDEDEEDEENSMFYKTLQKTKSAKSNSVLGFNFDDQNQNSDWDLDYKQKLKEKISSEMRKSVMISPRRARGSMAMNAYQQFKTVFDFDKNEQLDVPQDEENKKKRRSRGMMQSELPEISLETLLELEDNDRLGQDDGTVSMNHNFTSHDEFEQESTFEEPRKKSIEIIDVQSLFGHGRLSGPKIQLKTVNRESQ